jgi:hypothetical protein
LENVWVKSAKNESSSSPLPWKLLD